MVSNKLLYTLIPTLHCTGFFQRYHNKIRSRPKILFEKNQTRFGYLLFAKIIYNKKKLISWRQTPISFETNNRF